ncbi:MAG: EAL domain-containing protein, partial [Spirulina sp. SIO3F2]|nr:EAL domain-containing protein [Spirulina sp. SIO3F2]
EHVRAGHALVQEAGRLADMFGNIGQEGDDVVFDLGFDLINPGHLEGAFLALASFNDDTFLAFLQQQLAEHRISPEMICFEITETVAIENLDNAVQIINHLRQLGCQFSLDDFGTGMSSLTYLKTLPVDYVKIDGAFIRNLTTDPVNTAMVAAIGQICQVMGLKMIAECVEHRKLIAQLWDLGVSYVQGYGIAKPCPLEWVIGHANDSNHEHKGETSVVPLSIQTQAS